MEIIGTTLKGATKSVLVEEDGITISFRALYHGFVGDKRIPYASITAVQFKEPGGWLAGYIQFSIQGGREWLGPVNQDENAIQFDRKDADQFRMLRDLVRSKTESASAGTQPSSVSDELGKLADLRDRGILTEAEFATQKLKVLGS